MNKTTRTVEMEAGAWWKKDGERKEQSFNIHPVEEDKKKKKN